MRDTDRARERVAVRITPAVWRAEVERLAPRSRARVAAERERRPMEDLGIEPRQAALAAAPK